MMSLGAKSLTNPRRQNQSWQTKNKNDPVKKSPPGRGTSPAGLPAADLRAIKGRSSRVATRAPSSRLFTGEAPDSK